MCSIGLEVVGPHSKEVWPGPQLLNCPALGFAQLASNATVSGTGTWNQDKPNGSQRVATGHSTLIVDNKHFSFPLRVSASGRSFGTLSRDPGASEVWLR